MREIFLHTFNLPAAMGIFALRLRERCRVVAGLAYSGYRSPVTPQLDHLLSGGFQGLANTPPLGDESVVINLNFQDAVNSVVVATYTSQRPVFELVQQYTSFEADGHGVFHYDHTNEVGGPILADPPTGYYYQYLANDSEGQTQYRWWFPVADADALPPATPVCPLEVASLPRLGFTLVSVNQG